MSAAARRITPDNVDASVVIERDLWRKCPFLVRSDTDRLLEFSLFLGFEKAHLCKIAPSVVIDDIRNGGTILGHRHRRTECFAAGLRQITGNWCVVPCSAAVRGH